MNSNDQLDKINTFKVLVENYDDDNAVRYLDKTNWDESVNKN